MKNLIPLICTSVGRKKLKFDNLMTIMNSCVKHILNGDHRLEVEKVLLAQHRMEIRSKIFSKPLI